MDRTYAYHGKCDQCGRHEELTDDGLCMECDDIEGAVLHMCNRSQVRNSRMDYSDLWKLATARVRRLYSIREAQCIL